MNNEDRNAILEMIAERVGFETLETRNSDSLDFKEVAVWAFKKALEEAFEAGRIMERGE